MKTVATAAGSFVWFALRPAERVSSWFSVPVNVALLAGAGAVGSWGPAPPGWPEAAPEWPLIVAYVAALVGLLFLVAGTRLQLRDGLAVDPDAELTIVGRLRLLIDDGRAIRDRAVLPGAELPTDAMDLWWHNAGDFLEENLGKRRRMEFSVPKKHRQHEFTGTATAGAIDMWERMQGSIEWLEQLEKNLRIAPMR